MQFNLCSSTRLVTIYSDDGYKLSSLPSSLSNRSSVEGVGWMEYLYSKIKPCGPGSVVGIATAYWLDGPGIESPWGRDFPHLLRPALRPTQLPVQWVPGLSPGVRCGRGVTLTPHPLLVLR